VLAKKAKNTTTGGRKQGRARVAGGQDYEVRYEAKKSGMTTKAVQTAFKEGGNARKKVESALRGWCPLLG